MAAILEGYQYDGASRNDHEMMNLWIIFSVSIHILRHSRTIKAMATLLDCSRTNTITFYILRGCIHTVQFADMYVGREGNIQVDLHSYSTFNKAYNYPNAIFLISIL